MLLLLIGVAGLSLVGVVAVGLSLTVELLLGAALVGWGLLKPEDRRWGRAAVWREAQADMSDLTTLAGFAETLAVLQGRCALTAHRQGHGMAEELESALGRLAARGALTPEVRRELVQLTQSHLAGVHRLSEEVQVLLVQLVGRYDPAAAPRLWLRLLKWRGEWRSPG